MKMLLTLYGDETAFVNAEPEFVAREMAAWQAFDCARCRPVAQDAAPSAVAARNA